jgi:hypothetical protein
MKVHPTAEMFPPMTSEEFAALADDIEVNGLLEPITTLDGMILDGRHRDRACRERGVKPIYVAWDPKCGVTPLEWVVSRNLHRRQLTVAQKAALAVELMGPIVEAARQRQRDAGKKFGRGNSLLSRDPKLLERGRSAEIAAPLFGVSPASIARLARVQREDPAVFARAKAGEITVERARTLVGLLPSRTPARNTKIKLRQVLDPLRSYLKNWDESRLAGVYPAEARRLLKVVQEIDQALFEVERALEARTVVSRALR